MSILTRRVYGHTFFPGFLRPSSVVLDLGANQGRFCRTLQQSYGCRCFAIEANPNLCKAMAGDQSVQVLNYAVGATDGEARFKVEQNLEESSLASSDSPDADCIVVSCRRLETLVSELRLDRIDLVKMDVEGAEIDVLNACSDSLLGRIGQLTIEFHDFNGMIQSNQVEAVTQRLRKLGFRDFRGSRTNEDVLFINPAQCKMPPAKFFWAAHVERNVRGMARMVRRRMS